MPPALRRTSRLLRCHLTRRPTPAHNATGVATTGVSLKWQAGYWAHKYDIYFGTSPQPPLLASDQMLGPSQSATDYRTFALTAPLTAGTTYYWRIVSKTMADRTATSQVFSFTTAGSAPPPPPSVLPAPWSSRDVGAVGLPGSASFSNNTFTVKASGDDIWGSADGLHYVSQPMNGDFDIVARVASLEYVHAWTKAGVMIRQSEAAGAAQAMMLVSPAKGLAFQRRTADGGLTTSTAGGSGTAPVWVKLERRGATVKAYRSANGTAWTLVGSDTLTMTGGVQAGLGLAGHNNSRLATATFDSVTVTPIGVGSGTSGDTRAPSAQITSPADGASVSGTASIAVTAADNVAVAKVEMLLDGALVATDSARAVSVHVGHRHRVERFAHAAGAGCRHGGQRRSLAARAGHGEQHPGRGG